MCICERATFSRRACVCSCRAASRQFLFIFSCAFWVTAHSIQHPRTTHIFLHSPSAKAPVARIYECMIVLAHLNNNNRKGRKLPSENQMKNVEKEKTKQILVKSANFEINSLKERGEAEMRAGAERKMNRNENERKKEI